MPRLPIEDDEERDKQREFAIERMREDGEEIQIRKKVHKDLVDVSSIAVHALKKELESGGKGAVSAALGVLDRTGHPPVRKVQKEDSSSNFEPNALLRDAITELVALPDNILSSVISAILQSRPELVRSLDDAERKKISESVDSEVIEEVQEEEEIEIEEEDEDEEENDNLSILESSRVKITADDILEKDNGEAS